MPPHDFTGLALILLARAPGMVASTGLGPVLVPLPVEFGGGWGAQLVESREARGGGSVAKAGQHLGEDAA